MPLHYAALNGDPLLVRELLGLQADLNQGTKKAHPALGMEAAVSPLSISCLFGHNDVVQLLISSMAKLTSNALLNRPLHSAAAGNNADAVRMLCQASCPIEYNAFGQSVLQVAAYVGAYGAINELLRHPSPTLDASEALYNTAFGGADTEVVLQLVEKRADVNSQSAIHEA